MVDARRRYASEQHAPTSQIDSSALSLSERDEASTPTEDQDQYHSAALRRPLASGTSGGQQRRVRRRWWKVERHHPGTE